MMLFGEKIEKENRNKIVILLVLAILWRIEMGDKIQTSIRDSYIFPTLGFLLFALITGEITRKLYRSFRPESKIFLYNYTEAQIEKKRDQLTLNFAIFWAFAWLVLAFFEVLKDIWVQS